MTPFFVGGNLFFEDYGIALQTGHDKFKHLYPVRHQGITAHLIAQIMCLFNAFAVPV